MSQADNLILAWSGDRSVTKSIAADLARKMQNGNLERWHQLPDSDDLARHWNTSVRTVRRAMKLLADHDFIAKEGNRYHVTGPGLFTVLPVSREWRKSGAMSETARILLDPPDWPGLSNGQLQAFVESVNILLDFGVFRPPLAAELVKYRDAAGDEISARIAGKLRKVPERT